MEQIFNWLNIATKGAKAHSCFHIQTGFPPERHVFLSTSYCVSTGITGASYSLLAIKLQCCDHSKKSAARQGSCRSHTFCSIRSASPSSEDRETLGLIAHGQCRVSSAYDDQFVKLKINSANKSGKEIHIANIWGETAAWSQIFCEHLVRAISSSKIIANKIILPVLFWIQGSLNWKLKTKGRFGPAVFCRLTWDGKFPFTYLWAQSLVTNQTYFKPRCRQSLT